MRLTEVVEKARRRRMPLGAMPGPGRLAGSRQCVHRVNAAAQPAHCRWHATVRMEHQYRVLLSGQR